MREETEMTIEKNVAWYKERKKWEALAEHYMRSLKHVVKGSLQDKEIRSSNRSSRIRLIFESNRIEDAGLSEGETKKIIEDYFPKLSEPMFSASVESTNGEKVNFKKDLKNKLIDLFKSTVQNANFDFSSLDFNEIEEQDTVGSFLKVFKKFDMDKVVIGMKTAAERNIIIKPSVKFKSASRGLFEVTQHAQALEMADIYAYGVFCMQTIFRALLGEEVSDIRLDNVGSAVENFIGMIKGIHSVIAKDLLLPQDGVLSGNYRIDERYITGADIKLPTPDLIPSSMENLCLNFLNWVFVSDKRPWEVAAEFSYEFACIHPFPDFNGRMSRLLLDMTLRIYGIPFSIAIRGDKKGKARYLLALRHANRGNMDSYICLILRSLVESFQQIDANLTRAGVPTLLSLLPPDPEKNTPQPTT